MKKDIQILKVEDVFIAIAKEPNSKTDSSVWDVYIINDKDEDLSLVIILSNGFSKTQKTSTLRKKIDHLPKKSFAKFEIIQDELVKMTNEFKVSFFLNDRLYDKTFSFKPNSITEDNIKDLPLVNFKGVLAI